LDCIIVSFSSFLNNCVSGELDEQTVFLYDFGMAMLPEAKALGHHVTGGYLVALLLVFLASGFGTVSLLLVVPLPDGRELVAGSVQFQAASLFGNVLSSPRERRPGKADVHQLGDLDVAHDLIMG
jgi:hypothetical protein